VRDKVTTAAGELTAECAFSGARASIYEAGPSEVVMDVRIVT
jgi:hypothetical protein